MMPNSTLETYKNAHITVKMKQTKCADTSQNTRNKITIVIRYHIVFTDINEILIIDRTADYIVNILRRYKG